jgi:hypothetical protein
MLVQGQVFRPFVVALFASVEFEASTRLQFILPFILLFFQVLSLLHLSQIYLLLVLLAEPSIKLTVHLLRLHMRIPIELLPLGLLSMFPSKEHEQVVLLPAHP